MFAVFAVVAFTVALMFHLAGHGLGGTDMVTAVLAGLICLAAHFVGGDDLVKHQ